jgi:TrmH family RNA methyltransferase
MWYAADTMTKEMRKVAVVLVRPAGDLNIGASARAMKNTGFERMILVDPGPFQTQGAYQMAVSSKDILDKACCVPRLEEAIKDCQLVYGLTARPRHKRPRMSLHEGALHVRAGLQKGRKIALVFGPEDKGLSAEEVDLCQHLIGITAHGSLHSFNLAQAVLLVCHAVFLAQAPGLREGAKPYLASHADRERLERHALRLLKEVSYLTPNRENVLRDMTKRLVYRADLETRDVRNLLAILRHISHRVNLTP